MSEMITNNGREAERARLAIPSALGNRAAPPTIARLMTLALEKPDMLSLAAGFTDNATLPLTEVKEAVDVLASGLIGPEWLQ